MRDNTRTFVWSLCCCLRESERARPEFQANSPGGWYQERTPTRGSGVRKRIIWCFKRFIAIIRSTVNIIKVVSLPRRWWTGGRTGCSSKSSHATTEQKPLGQICYSQLQCPEKNTNLKSTTTMFSLHEIAKSHTLRSRSRSSDPLLTLGSGSAASYKQQIVTNILQNNILFMPVMLSSYKG